MLILNVVMNNHVRYAQINLNKVRNFDVILLLLLIYFYQKTLLRIS